MATGLADLARRLRADSFLSVNVNVSPLAVEALTHEQTRALLHIAKEALANARKHARATRIDIRLRLDDDRVRLVIEDDGVGMDAAANQPEQGPGKGLANMAQRAEQLGGTLAIDSAGIGRGTQVAVACDQFRDWARDAGSGDRAGAGCIRLS